MRMSSGSRRDARLAIVLSTTAAGTINQTTRGFCNFLTNSSSEDDPTAFSPTSSLTALGDLSKTTHSWPPLIRRRTILAPILPRPTIPNCMNLSFSYLYECVSVIDATPPASSILAICSWPLSLLACRQTPPFRPLIHWHLLQRRKARSPDRFLHPIRDR